ncbi:hypothetical protein TNCV_1541061 [Trichonephila clavipes]|nr:hypothetical protein TNCV_1541061 [Trichonephila clavipes]
MLFEFQKENNAMEAKRNLCDVCGEEAVTAQRWLVELCPGEYSLKDEPRSGRSSEVSDEVLLSRIRTNPTLTSSEVGF